VAEEGPAAEDLDLAAQLEAELANLRLADVLLQTVALASTIAYRKLTPESRDLEEARLAIDTLRALMPLVEGKVPPEASRDMQQAVMNLQLLYASAASPSTPPPEPAATEAPADQEDEGAVDGGG
jgi:hypothetical protein